MNDLFVRAPHELFDDSRRADEDAPAAFLPIRTCGLVSLPSDGKLQSNDPLGENFMKKIAALVILGMMAVEATGCAYGGAAATGDKVVILRNDSFLFGALRKVFVCKVTDGGVASCAANESP